MVPQDVLKTKDYMCLVEKEESRQLVWTVIFMVVEEIWKVFMIVCCAGTRKDKIHGLESSP